MTITNSCAPLPTGIAGLDQVTGGGLPRKGITVIVGDEGAGKTVFSAHVLAASMRDGHPGILVAFEQSARQILGSARSLPSAADLTGGGALCFLDARLAQCVETGGEFDLIGLLALVADKARSSGARCVVFDGLHRLLDYLGDARLIRREILRLRAWANETGLTAIVTAKSHHGKEELPHDYCFLPFVADCVITLRHRVVQGAALRFVRVAKCRGAAHSPHEFPLAIEASGTEPPHG
jgi:circadian clock protein KaiC